jgi:general secretion pathway protein E
MPVALTKEYIGHLMLEEALLTEDQFKEFQLKADTQQLRIMKQREKSTRRRGRDPVLFETVSPIELLASFNFEVKGGKGEVLTEERIMESLARVTGWRYRKIDPLKLDAAVVTTLIPRPFAMKHAVLPLHLENEVLTVALADPFDEEVLDSLRQSTGCRLDPVLSARSDILKIITEFFGFKSSVTAAEKELEPQIDLGNLEQYVKLKTGEELEATDKHVIRAVDYMLQYAYDQRASDIHIEPKRDHSLIRFRIDGVLHPVHRMPKVVHAAVVARIKTLSRLDIAEKRRPQDGRIKTDHKGREIELRVSTLPVAFGEKAVIRIFDPDILLQDLTGLGFFPREHRLFQSFLSRPHGIILVTGPTGSGKTTTLYSAMKALAAPEVNVTSIEDPIEMIYDGFNQVGIQPQIGITFASSVRTVLRQDPDILMIGEIRDKDTADAAIQAALTGHLVFSTLHTNDSVTAITRLLDLGVPAFLLTPTLIGVAAQRLMRKICSGCHAKTDLPMEAARALGLDLSPDRPLQVGYGKGCVQCRGTGYSGRTGIFEMFEVNDEVRSLIQDRADLHRIRQAALKQGMTTLRAAAIRKMLQAETTFEEVIWVTGEGGE